MTIKSGFFVEVSSFITDIFKFNSRWALLAPTCTPPLGFTTFCTSAQTCPGPCDQLQRSLSPIGQLLSRDWNKAIWLAVLFDFFACQAPHVPNNRPVPSLVHGNVVSVLCSHWLRRGCFRHLLVVYISIQGQLLTCFTILEGFKKFLEANLARFLESINENVEFIFYACICSRIHIDLFTLHSVKKILNIPSIFPNAPAIPGRIFRAKMFKFPHAFLTHPTSERDEKCH